MVEKCTFCTHRIDPGLERGLVPGVDPQATPACVEACPTNARQIGNIDDQQSEIFRLIQSNPVIVMKPEMNTRPMVFYINADQLTMDARGGAPWKKVHE